MGDPIKRVVAEVGHGHDVLRALLRDRAPSSELWRAIGLERAGNEFWRARFSLGALGLHHHPVISWIDALTTWRDEGHGRLGFEYFL